MLASLHTFSLLGIDAVPVDVEVDVSTSGLPKTILVGLPEAAVRESTHRVERSLVNSGFQRPQHRVVVNLAPAELPKQAASFDLPIGLGFLASSGQLTTARFSRYAAVGELSLEGQTRPVKGVLSMALSAARQPGLKGIVVPAASAAEAAVVESLEVIPVANLQEAVAFFSGEEGPPPQKYRPLEVESARVGEPSDYAEVSGQETAKRALTLAAAGAHNLLMIGPPGSGKTMLAKRLPSILPPLSVRESLETTRVYSAMGRLDPDQTLMTVRPFRSPHHSISDAGLVGGGSTPVPGEISSRTSSYKPRSTFRPPTSTRSLLIMTSCCFSLLSRVCPASSCTEFMIVPTANRSIASPSTQLGQTGKRRTIMVSAVAATCPPCR
ncbi:MAG: magnesium chelatase [Planctomycetaceae bacterium]|nr:magnesium chelatase [Planctomycetaceae bacterium]